MPIVPLEAIARAGHDARTNRTKGQVIVARRDVNAGQLVGFIAVLSAGDARVLATGLLHAAEIADRMEAGEL